MAFKSMSFAVLFILLSAVTLKSGVNGRECRQLKRASPERSSIQIGRRSCTWVIDEYTNIAARHKYIVIKAYQDSLCNTTSYLNLTEVDQPGKPTYQVDLCKTGTVFQRLLNGTIDINYRSDVDPLPYVTVEYMAIDPPEGVTGPACDGRAIEVTAIENKKYLESPHMTLYDVNGTTCRWLIKAADNNSFIRNEISFYDTNYKPCKDVELKFYSVLESNDIEPILPTCSIYHNRVIKSNTSSMLIELTVNFKGKNYDGDFFLITMYYEAVSLAPPTTRRPYNDDDDEDDTLLVIMIVFGIMGGLAILGFLLRCCCRSCRDKGGSSHKRLSVASNGDDDGENGKL